MGLFDFLKKNNKKQSKELDEWLKQSLEIIFPKGEQDIIEGTKRLLAILHNKVDAKTARKILLRSSGLSYTHSLREEALEKERLKQHLAGYCLSYFGDKELDELYLYLLDLQNKIRIEQFFKQMPKEMKELFFSELQTNTQACNTDEIPNTVGQFGLDPTNPVPVYFIPSSNIYLERLRTTDGQSIKWERDGSLSIPSIEKSIDKYKIFDNAGKFLTHIYISPYHKKTSKKAPKGFKMVGGYSDIFTDDKKVILCDSSEDFYDKMFDSFAYDFFCMSQYRCFVKGKKIYAGGEVEEDDYTQKTQSVIAGYAFLWLRNLNKQNIKLYKHILSIANEDKNEDISNEDKKFFIKGIFGKNIEQLFSDNKVVNAIFIRASAYNLLINRLTNALLSFYLEHRSDEDADYYVSYTNQAYLPTREILNTDNFIIQDIERIFLRDMLGRENLLGENTISEKKSTSKATLQKQTINSDSPFTNSNGEPLVLKHNCPPERVGKEMTKEELHKFAVELLSNLYEKSGMTMVNINKNYHREYPNIVMKSRNGKLYYVIIETTCYPKKADSLYSADFTEMKQYAKEFNATPVFAGMSFMNASREQHKLICGDDYFVAFKGLEAI